MPKSKFRLDSTGFPMVWVESIGAYLHWLPITKIQFEYFLCSTPDSRFDSNWYDGLLQLNPRVTPKSIRANNYWNAFLTGITPNEVQHFMRWSGDGYSIPTSADWFAAYKSLKNSRLEDSGVIDQMGSLRDRVKTLLNRIEAESSKMFVQVGYDRTLADQMLMRMGVMEWVECPNQRSPWGAIGEPPPSFHGSLMTPDSGQPSTPNNPNDERLSAYGFRLMWREEE